MKKFKIAVALACVMTALLAINASAISNQTTQKTYTPGQIILCNDGDPAI